ncbi:MAG: hypothetical protein ABID61_00210 [Candidatus Micrarchaeota archaeon]|nr:hypothetical protein [Patescibacteria group bacterium]
MLRNKIHKGILLGAIAGVIDVVPMILQNLTWDANLSAFVHWVIAGFVISTSDLKMKGPVKGLVISALLAIPIMILVGWSDPVSIIPIGIMTVILGSLLGYLIDKN